MAPLRELLATFGIEVDDRQLKNLNRSLDDTVSKIGTFAKIVAGVVSGGALAKFIGDTIETGFQLRRTADMLGTTTDELQFWRFSANNAGESADKFDRALRFMLKNVGKAEAGMKGATDEFARWGIIVKKDDKVPLFDRLAQFSDKLVAMPDAAQRTRAAMAIFGIAGAQVLPWLLKGSAALRAQREEWKKLGGGMSAEFIERASEVAEKGRRIQAAFVGLRAAAVLPLLDGIGDLGDKMVDWIAKGIKVVANSEIVKSALIVMTGAFVAAGVAAAIAFAPYLLFAAALVVAALAIDDLWVALEGGKSYFRDFLEEKYGPKGAEEVLGKFRVTLSETKDKLIETGDQVGILAKQLGIEIGRGLPDFLDVLTSSLEILNESITPVLNSLSVLWNMARLLFHSGGILGASSKAWLNQLQSITASSGSPEEKKADADYIEARKALNEQGDQAGNDLYNIAHAFDAAQAANARGFTSGPPNFPAAPTLGSFTGQNGRVDNKITSLEGAQIQSNVNNEIHIHGATDPRATGIEVARHSGRTEAEAYQDAAAGYFGDPSFPK